MRPLLVLAFLTSLSLISSGAVEAAPILYSFSGQIGSSGGNAVPLGSSIQGSFTYDPDAPVGMLGTNFASFFPTVAALSATVGGNPFQAAGTVREETTHSVGINIPPLPNNVYDQFVATNFTPSVIPPVLALRFVDADQTAFATFNVLPGELPLGAFEFVQFELVFFDLQQPPQTQITGIGAGLVRVTPAVVPEPSTLLLLGSSLAGLGGFAWRRQRRK